MSAYVAPGKLVLCGEYAVVDGAPAISAAVDSGVRLDRSPAATRTIAVPGGDDRFVRAALDAAGVRADAWRFSAWRPLPTDSKPGIGGSAAATVVAILAACPDLDRAALHARAHAVHHAVQGGGSGIDVATSVFGGTIRFTPGRPVEPLPSPPAFVVIWSGQSATTGDRVARYRSWADRAAFTRRSAEVVDLFSRDPIAALREGWSLLASADRAAGLGWETPAHRRIRDLAETLGGAAKPSGAGGGDCAIAILPDSEAQARFILDCAALGFTRLDLRGASGAGSLDEASQTQ